MDLLRDFDHLLASARDYVVILRRANIGMDLLLIKLENTPQETNSNKFKPKSK